MIVMDVGTRFLARYVNHGMMYLESESELIHDSELKRWFPPMYLVTAGQEKIKCQTKWDSKSMFTVTLRLPPSPSRNFYH